MLKCGNNDCRKCNHKIPCHLYEKKGKNQVYVCTKWWCKIYDKPVEEMIGND